MKTVWVIEADAGNYDDNVTWVDSVWSSKARAKTEQDRKSREMRELYMRKDTLKADPHASGFTTYHDPKPFVVNQSDDT